MVEKFWLGEELKEEKNLQFLTKEDLNSNLRYTFSRHERLKSKHILASLFEKGSLFVCKPVRIKYLIEPAETFSMQAAFSVPKRRFKLAVDRNKLKRKLREVHRLHQHIIKTELIHAKLKISIIYIYNRNEMLDYQTLESAILPFYHELVEAAKKTMS